MMDSIDVALPDVSYDDDPVTAWAVDVVRGDVVAGPHVRNACLRHLLDLRDGPARGLVWDLETANKRVKWFGDKLRLNGGQFEGRWFTLHPSQAFRVGSLFGWKWAETGLRRFYDEEGTHSRAINDPQVVLVIEIKRFGQGVTGDRPHRAHHVHDRTVFKSGIAQALPSRV